VGGLAHAEVVNDEQRHAREFVEVLFACTGERRVGKFRQQCVRFAVDDALALLDA